MIDAEIMDMEDGSPKIHPPKEQKEVGNKPSFLNCLVQTRVFDMICALLKGAERRRDDRGTEGSKKSKARCNHTHSWHAMVGNHLCLLNQNRFT